MAMESHPTHTHTPIVCASSKRATLVELENAYTPMWQCPLQSLSYKTLQMTSILPSLYIYIYGYPCVRAGVLGCTKAALQARATAHCLRLQSAHASCKLMIYTEFQQLLHKAA